MDKDDDILALAKSEVGDDKDKIIAYLCHLLRGTASNVSPGYLRAVPPNKVRDPKPPPKSI